MHPQQAYKGEHSAALVGIEDGVHRDQVASIRVVSAISAAGGHLMSRAQSRTVPVSGKRISAREMEVKTEMRNQEIDLRAAAPSYKDKVTAAAVAKEDEDDISQHLDSKITCRYPMGSQRPLIAVLQATSKPQAPSESVGPEYRIAMPIERNVVDRKEPDFPTFPPIIGLPRKGSTDDPKIPSRGGGDA
ncbi:hypothetical protein MAPG_03993 [Magnaporthiopsis poae ATCC 64411]|uniref:Uncharacterized protein n=1 Tax=Magnaporthiopsis poae (strain ATCC 64411 / 73-15) TaxID=644358 RepID=A0A0C4DVI7_MAGP6|nr:hypothetical protein MAPG_03993 [Magnaporthiopsis poae ATCC 64411]